MNFNRGPNTVQYSLPSNCVCMRARKGKKDSFKKLFLIVSQEETICIIYKLCFDLRSLKKAFKSR